MTKDELYEIWAPAGGRWSPWVKPVLFGFMAETTISPPLAAPEPQIDLSWAPPADGSTAMVLDLPGASGVLFGMALAAAGYCPVPLYNAIPRPSIELMIGETSLVDMETIVRALRDATPALSQSPLSHEAPPAFLLDANRGGSGLRPMPRQFDNRSVSFTTDFPSAVFLQAHGVGRAVLVQSTGDPPQPDLAHTLRGWQEGGLRLGLKQLDLAGGPVPLVVDKPTQFGLLWQRALAALGLRRSPFGGFGGMVPEPSSG